MVWFSVQGECKGKLYVAGFITEWKGESTLNSLKIELQFLDHHKMQFLDLHREMAKIEYSPQSEAALQNFKTLLLLEIALLLGSSNLD